MARDDLGARVNRHAGRGGLWPPGSAGRGIPDAPPVRAYPAGAPPKPSEAGSVGRGGTVEGTSFAVYGEASDP